MFDQFKQLAELKKIKDVIDKIEKEVEVNGVKIVMSGRLQVKEVVLNPELNEEQQANAVRDCVNAALIQIQQEITIKMRSAQLGI